MVYGAWLWDNNHDIGFTTEIDMDEALTPYYEIRRLASILLGGMIFMTTVLILLIFKDQKKYRNEIEGLYLDLEQKYQEKTQHLRDSEFELKVSTKKAQQANEAKSNFLANMSHEIRTPINGILGFTDILAESNLDDEQKKCTSIIVKSSRSLLVIINDILDFSKIEAGKMSFEKISMDINLVVDDVLKLYSEKAIEKGIVISKRADPNIPHYILGDPTRINQIILNLFSNAIKFTEKGSITINLKVESSAHDNSSNLRIEIKDTGIGITKEQQENIFDSFTQADLSTTRKFGGTGLGTTISQRLVKLMGGDIGVESEPGVGSCFYFTIPLETTKDNLSS